MDGFVWLDELKINGRVSMAGQMTLDQMIDILQKRAPSPFANRDDFGITEISELSDCERHPAIKDALELWDGYKDNIDVVRSMRTEDKASLLNQLKDGINTAASADDFDAAGIKEVGLAMQTILGTTTRIAEIRNVSDYIVGIFQSKGLPLEAYDYLQKAFYIVLESCDGTMLSNIDICEARLFEEDLFTDEEKRQVQIIPFVRSLIAIAEDYAGNIEEQIGLWAARGIPQDDILTGALRRWVKDKDSIFTLNDICEEMGVYMTQLTKLRGILRDWSSQLLETNLANQGEEIPKARLVPTGMAGFVHGKESIDIGAADINENLCFILRDKVNGSTELIVVDGSTTVEMIRARVKSFSRNNKKKSGAESDLEVVLVGAQEEFKPWQGEGKPPESDEDIINQRGWPYKIIKTALAACAKDKLNIANVQIFDQTQPSAFYIKAKPGAAEVEKGVPAEKPPYLPAHYYLRFIKGDNPANIAFEGGKKPWNPWFVSRDSATIHGSEFTTRTIEARMEHLKECGVPKDVCPILVSSIDKAQEMILGARLTNMVEVWNRAASKWLEKQIMRGKITEEVSMEDQAIMRSPLTKPVPIFIPAKSSAGNPNSPLRAYFGRDMWKGDPQNPPSLEPTFARMEENALKYNPEAQAAKIPDKKPKLAMAK